MLIVCCCCTHAERHAACLQLVDEFVRAIFGRFPHTVLQFEVRLHFHCWLSLLVCECGYKCASVCTPTHVGICGEGNMLCLASALAASIMKNLPSCSLHACECKSAATALAALSFQPAPCILEINPRKPAPCLRRTSTWRTRRPCWSATATRTWSSMTISRAPQPVLLAAYMAQWLSRVRLAHCFALGCLCLYVHAERSSAAMLTACCIVSASCCWVWSCAARQTGLHIDANDADAGSCSVWQARRRRP